MFETLSRGWTSTWGQPPAPHTKKFQNSSLKKFLDTPLFLGTPLTVVKVSKGECEISIREGQLTWIEIFLIRYRLLCFVNYFLLKKSIGLSKMYKSQHFSNRQPQLTKFTDFRLLMTI